MKNKPVLITTQHRGVFFGFISEETDTSSTIIKDIKNCRMAIYWGTDKGVMQLADTGPTNDSRIGAPADIEVLHDVTAIFNVKDEAVEKWMSA